MPSRDALRFLSSKPVLALGAVLVVAAFSAPTPAAGGRGLDRQRRHRLREISDTRCRRGDLARSCRPPPACRRALVQCRPDLHHPESRGHRRIPGGTAEDFQAHPISGFGDGAYWNGAGAFSAVKGHDRGCDISVIDPGAPKIHNAELGQKLGEICNKLFAIP